MVTEEEQSDMELASEMVPVPQVQNEVRPNNECEKGDINNECEKIASNNELPNPKNNLPRRKPRTRKKELHASIRKQMEFYFSDANLSKDRFLGNLLKKDPFVGIEVFLRFNKIRSLTLEPVRIAKALRESEILSVSEDGTKVCRITPIVEKTNSDECTVYVQRVPPHADHEMLSSLFSKYGPISYISIPRYKINRKIKGFAFVEFDTPESAKKCMKAFSTKGCVLPSQTSPRNVLSISTYEEEEMEVSNTEQNKKMNTENIEFHSDRPLKREPCDELDEGTSAKKAKKHSLDDSLNSSSESTKKGKRKKRKKEAQENSDAEIQKSDAEGAKIETVVKSNDKQKDESVPNEETNESTKDTKDQKQNLKKNKRKRKLVEETAQGNDEEDHVEPEDKLLKVEETEESDAKNEEGNKSVQKKKKRKRTRKRHAKIEEFEATDMGFQVMAKKDWKRLRNKYLDLQKSKLKQLKQHLRKARWNQWNSSEKSKMEKDESENMAVVKSESGIRDFAFTPGVIVKIDMDNPCVDLKNFKTELKGNNGVKYVDISEGSTTAYIRCDAVETANELAQKSTVERKMAVIKDDEEKWYWDKIVKDRKDKLGKKVRVKQRGRNKLLKKAEKELGKHIKFEEV